MRRTRGREGDARVLVVEDDPDLSRLMAAHLASEGYDVARAPEASAALELVGAGCVDVVVLDLMLPRVSGDGLLVRLRERERAGTFRSSRSSSSPPRTRCGPGSTCCAWAPTTT